MAKRIRKKGFGAIDKLTANIKTLEGKSRKSIKARINTSIQVESFADIEKLKTKLPAIIVAANKKTVALVARELKVALDEAMESAVWQWDYGDGDIVDTGALRDSARVVPVSDGDIYIFYNEKYAGIVHYGGYIHPYGNPDIQIYMPARPWIQSVLEGGGPVPRYDFEGVYERIFVPEINRLLSSANMT